MEEQTGKRFNIITTMKEQGRILRGKTLSVILEVGERFQEEATTEM